ncbi:POT family proton-dependent oligopeptide transporter [Elusimicrobium simillimum]|uniref:peptide MFS transporter n=1 Tax=Elusimicrobium simillimum TaxID=3143438 RepID=UPI003C7061A4
MTENTKKSQPGALYMLSGVELCERFCFYGARTILVLFMISPALGFGDQPALRIFGLFMAFVYLTPVFGGIAADHFLSKKACVIIGALLMILGQFTIASYDILPAKAAFTIGVVLLICGVGFIKPNLTSLVGDLYGDNDHRRDAGFTIFYMAINIGAFLSPLVCSYLGERIAFKYGFMAAGVGMAIGLAWFLFIKNTHLRHIGDRAVKTAGAAASKEPLTQQEKDRIKAIFIFAFFTIFFWAFYEQSGSSLTLFAERATNKSLFGFNITTGSLQALPPLFVIILAPVFAWLWNKLGVREPSTPIKFAWGLGLLGASFLIIVLGAYIYQKTGAVISVFWLAGLYFVSVLGELCLSPVGLSMITKLAPARYGVMFMGIWFTGNFLGGLLGGVYAGFYNEAKLAKFFSVPALCAIGCAFIIWLISGRLTKWMHGVK